MGQGKIEPHPAVLMAHSWLYTQSSGDSGRVQGTIHDAGNWIFIGHVQEICPNHYTTSPASEFRSYSWFHAFCTISPAPIPILVLSMCSLIWYKAFKVGIIIIIIPNLKGKKIKDNKSVFSDLLMTIHIGLYTFSPYPGKFNSEIFQSFN